MFDGCVLETVCVTMFEDVLWPTLFMSHRLGGCVAYVGKDESSMISWEGCVA